MACLNKGPSNPTIIATSAGQRQLNRRGRVIAKADVQVRLLQVTDPHLFADSASSLRGRVTQKSLQSVLDHIQASAWPADIVAVTGDLIQDHSDAAYDRFCTLLSALELPVYCVPGNHDVRAKMQQALQRPAFHYCENARLGNWLVVSIDSCRPDCAAGEISRDEYQRLHDILDTCDAEHILICLHHPPLPINSKWLDAVGLKNADRFFDLIAEYPQVRGAIFGHVHQAFDATCRGIRIIGTPSTCRQFEPGSDAFAIDDKPPAYRRLGLLDDGTIDTELVWVAN